MTRASVETAVNTLDYKGITTEVKFQPNGEVAQVQTVNLYQQKDGDDRPARQHQGPEVTELQSHDDRWAAPGAPTAGHALRRLSRHGA